MDKKENIETAETGKRKSSRDWKKQAVVFLVLPIILTVLVPLDRFTYLCGRLNYSLTNICLFYPVVFVFIIYCFVTGIGRFFRDWKKSCWKGKFLIVAQISIPIVFAVLYIKPFFIHIESDLRPPGNAFTYGFKDRIRSKADIEAIRDWLKTLSKDDYNSSSHYNPIPPDKQPKSLKVLKHGTVHLLADENGNPKVRIVWGGGFFHWGVEIGMEDMVIPPSDFNQMDEYWLLVEPGVYVWDRG